MLFLKILDDREEEYEIEREDYRTRETADLFLVLIMRLLKPGGRCGIVLPDGTLFGEGVKTRIKTELLETCNVHTIVRLPNGVFNPYTGLRTRAYNLDIKNPHAPEAQQHDPEELYQEYRAAVAETERIATQLRDQLAAYLQGASE